MYEVYDYARIYLSYTSLRVTIVWYMTRKRLLKTKQCSICTAVDPKVKIFQLFLLSISTSSDSSNLKLFNLCATPQQLSERRSYGHIQENLPTVESSTPDIRLHPSTRLARSIVICVVCMDTMLMLGRLLLWWVILWVARWCLRDIVWVETS